LFGFDARQEITASAAFGLKVAFVAWPCLLLVPMLVLAWRYPLGRRAHGILARRLERRLESHA
jgi:Na+/melibiose symporter-like transporter